MKLLYFETVGIENASHLQLAYHVPDLEDQADTQRDGLDARIVRLQILARPADMEKVSAPVKED